MLNLLAPGEECVANLSHTDTCRFCLWEANYAACLLGIMVSYLLSFQWFNSEEAAGAKGDFER